MGSAAHWLSGFLASSASRCGEAGKARCAGWLPRAGGTGVQAPRRPQLMTAAARC